MSKAHTADEAEGVVTRVVVRRTETAAELWFYGTCYGDRDRMLAEQIRFAVLLKSKTPQSILEGLEKGPARRMAKHWGLRVQREGW